MPILAGERYRQVLVEAIGLGTTEGQALSYLERIDPADLELVSASLAIIAKDFAARRAGAGGSA